MSFCGHCGARLIEADRFCTRCGTERRVLPSPLPAHTRRIEPESDGESSVLLHAGVSDPVSISRVSEPENAEIAGRDLLTLAGAGSPAPLHRVAMVAGALLVIGLSAYCGRFLVMSRRPATVAAPATVTPAPGPPPVTETTEELSSSKASGSRVNGSSAVWRIDTESTRDTKNAADALGDADGRVATVLPGGMLALRYSAGEFFYNGTGPDVRVVGPEGERTPYAIFAKADPNGTWVRFDINRRGFPKGVAAHDFGHHGLARASALMIRNDGPINLYVDAVVPLYREPVAEDEHDEHVKRP